MPVPTLAEVKAVAAAWWREPGRPRIDVLRARLAALCTDPFTSIRAAIVNVPPWTLFVRYEQRDASGAVLNTITRSATKDDLDALVAREFYQICDDDNRTPEERGDPL